MGVPCLTFGHGTATIPAGRWKVTKTHVVRLLPGEAGLAQTRDIARALLDGAVAAYPTETFYALGAAAFLEKAVNRIFRLKRRDTAKPLSFIVSDLDMIRSVAVPPSPFFVSLAGEFWPGPLTIVLPAAASVPERLLGPARTIALRVPPLAWLRALVRELGEPLTATSANLSGEKELTDPQEVKELFEGKVDLVLDGGPAPGGPPSTIVDLSGERPRILREGRIPAARIEAFIRG
jgi:L-threonylcarbamoyladenylate synthase